MKPDNVSLEKEKDLATGANMNVAKKQRKYAFLPGVSDNRILVALKSDRSDYTFQEYQGVTVDQRRPN